jgi:hypothetical protein
MFQYFPEQYFFIKISLRSNPKTIYESRRIMKFKTMYPENKKQNLDFQFNSNGINVNIFDGFRQRLKETQMVTTCDY